MSDDNEKQHNNTNINPLLERARLPGETFRLPSCGVFYNNGELSDDIEDAEVHVYPMTAIDEIVLSSPAKLFSGDAIVEVITKCVPSILKPMELLAQDVDFILLCLRKVSYGTNFEFDKIHEDCEKQTEERGPLKHSYIIDVNSIIRQTKELESSKISTMYRIELDNGQVIKMQPMRFGPYIKIMQVISNNLEDSSLDEEGQKNLILDQLASMISSVDEISDQKNIREWLEYITPQQVRTINDYVSNMGSWGIIANTKVSCKDCKKDMEVEMPTNPLALFS